MEPGRLWKMLAAGEVPHWCHACERFRSGVCARIEADRTHAALRGMETRFTNLARKR